jgi:hypothetical protein
MEKGRNGVYDGGVGRREYDDPFGAPTKKGMMSMTKKRPAGTEPPTEPQGKESGEKKYSVLIPESLDHKLGQIMKKRRVKLSALLREIISENIDRYVNEAFGRGELDELGFLTAQPNVLHVELPAAARRLLAETARDHSMKAAAVIQLLLSRHLPSLAAEGRRLREKMQAALGGEGDDHTGGRAGPAE